MVMKLIPKIAQIYNPDIAVNIPRDIFEDERIGRKIKSVSRLYRRFLTLCFAKQAHLLYDRLPDKGRILWINVSSTSIGDSIMELSGRVLLKDMYQVDLLTDSRNVSLYKDDPIFDNVYSSLPINTKYDFIILDILNTKSIRVKAKHFPKLPFVTLRGYWLGTYMGSDYNRMLFSYHRINQLISLKYSEDYVNQVAQNYLGKVDRLAQVDNISLTIAIGGEDPIRTYNKWHEVISVLNKIPDLTINLVGSNNGINDADVIVGLGCKVNNYVGKLSLVETRDLIAQSSVFIGTDGGLMHIAEAYNLPGVVLFALFRPDYRLSYHSKLLPLTTKYNVNDINSEEICTLLLKVIDGISTQSV